jgi:Pretoxin HINT domain
MPRSNRSSVWLPLAVLSVLAAPFAICAEPDSLQAVLEKESNGTAVNRRLPTGSQPLDDASAWQAGMLKIQDQWRSIEELSQSESHDAYKAKREEHKYNPQRHLVLARWCALNQLPDLARAHYFGVLALDPNNLEARKYLKHVLIGDSWVEQAELKTAQEKLQQNFDKLDQYTPRIRSIAQGLTSGRTKVMSDALSELENIETLEALPALELFASNVDDDLAKPIVRKIVQERSPETCAALVRIALAHPSPEIKKIAVDAIRKYPEAYYIPDLLGMLSSEIKVENQLVMQPNGNFGLITLFRNELQNRTQLQRAQKLVNVVAKFSSHHSAALYDTTTADMSYWSEFWNVSKSDPVKLGKLTSDKSRLDAGSASASSIYVPREIAQSVTENLQEQGKQQERAVAQKNRQLMTNTNRVCTLLRSITGEDLGDKPELWWNWWNDRNERYLGNKPVAFSYSEQRESIVVSTQRYNSVTAEHSHDLGHVQIQYSCLVPGTLVQTATGLVPIEKIQVGDLVVSQNIETAELTLKPVILTTIRPPKSTIKITAGEDIIEATGGHLWWVSGHGWVKSRDLKPGMMLHTATGTAEVASLTPNPTPQPTHNLVVDGFHTYFVGPHRVLSYDNTQVKPTLRQVPGHGQIANVLR